VVNQSESNIPLANEAEDLMQMLEENLKPLELQPNEAGILK